MVSFYIDVIALRRILWCGSAAVLSCAAWPLEWHGSCHLFAGSDSLWHAALALSVTATVLEVLTFALAWAGLNTGYASIAFVPWPMAQLPPVARAAQCGSLLTFGVLLLVSGLGFGLSAGLCSPWPAVAAASVIGLPAVGTAGFDPR